VPAALPWDYTRAMPTRLVDLSHTISDGLITYRGLPAPVIGDFLSREQSRGRYAEGTEFQIGRIEMVANTGTYLDSPFHRFADGVDLAGLELAVLADLPATVVRHHLGSGRAVDREALAGRELRGRAVLIHTGWARYWSQERYCEGHPFLTRAAAAHLVEEGAALVGMDTYNIDDTTDGARPAHTLLLGAGIPVAEHLTGLEALPAEGARFFAVPVKVRGMGSFPVRAFAIVPGP
jgi:kynurenine formamidase